MLAVQTLNAGSEPDGVISKGLLLSAGPKPTAKCPDGGSEGLRAPYRGLKVRKSSDLHPQPTTLVDQGKSTFRPKHRPEDVLPVMRLLHPLRRSGGALQGREGPALPGAATVGQPQIELSRRAGPRPRSLSHRGRPGETSVRLDFQTRVWA